MSMEQMNGEAGLARRTVTIGAAVAMLGGAVIGYNAMRGDNAAEADGSKDTTEWVNVHNKDNPNCIELTKAAGITDNLDVTVNGKTYKIVKSDLGYMQEGRQYTNALRVPLNTESDVNAGEAKLKAEFCQDAPFAVATANVLGNVVYKGQRLADTKGGEWLKPYADLKDDELNDKAENLLGNDLKDTDVEGHFKRYQTQAKLAEDLAATLTNLENEGIVTGKTDVDVSYSDQSFVDVNGVPELAKKHGQFVNAEALVFGVLLKGQKCVDIIMGFNTGIGANGSANEGDQRPETFVQENCKTPENTPTTIKGKTTRTTLAQRTPTTLRTYGPKQDAHPPVNGGSPTTVEAPQPGPNYPTTSTTEAPQQTPPPEDPTPTTAPTTPPPRP